MKIISHVPPAPPPPPKKDDLIGLTFDEVQALRDILGDQFPGVTGGMFETLKQSFPERASRPGCYTPHDRF